MSEFEKVSEIIKTILDSKYFTIPEKIRDITDLLKDYEMRNIHEKK